MWFYAVSVKEHFERVDDFFDAILGSCASVSISAFVSVLEVAVV